MILDLQQILSLKALKEYRQWLKTQKLPQATIKRKLSSLRKFKFFFDNTYLKKSSTGIYKSGSEDIRFSAVSSRRPRAFRWLLYPLISLLISLLVFWLFSQNFESIPKLKQLIIQPQTVTPIAEVSAGLTDQSWLIEFQAQFETVPQTLPIPALFQLYAEPSGGSPLWTSKTWQITPDSQGNYRLSLGDITQNDQLISSDLFFQNELLYLEATIADQTLSPRFHVSTAANSANALFLRKYSPQIEATALTIPVLDENGALILAAAAPKIQASQGALAIIGQAITLQTPFASDGDIVIAPDGSGTSQFRFTNATESSMTITNANLNHDSLIYGYLGNDSTVPNLLRLTSGSTEKDAFLVKPDGKLQIEGALSDITDASLTIDDDLIINGGDITGKNSVNLDLGEISSNYVVSSVGLAVGGGTTYYFNSSGDLKAHDGHFTDDLVADDDFEAKGQITLGDGGEEIRIDASDGGNLTLTGFNTCLLETDGSGTVTCGTSVASAVFWTQGSGALYPKNSTVDLLVGGQATSSAKFAVVNMNSGTPTASISGSSSGNALYLTGDGTIATSLNRSLLLNPDGGNVGIGTSTPTQPLEVDGNALVAGRLAVGSSATINTTRTVNVLETTTATSGLASGVYDYLKIEPTANSTAGYRAVVGVASAFEDNPSSTVNINSGGYMAGGRFISQFYGSGTLLEGVGSFSWASNAGAGTVNNLYGSQVELFNNEAAGHIDIGQAFRAKGLAANAGSIDSYTAFYAVTPVNTGAGSITTAYGVYLEDQTGATTNYAIVTNAGDIVFNEGGDANTDLRVEGDTDANLLFTNATTDKVGIGTNTPLEKLDVRGNATASGNLVLAGAARNVQTTDLNSLIIGGNTTGQIYLQPNADTGDYFSFTSDGTDLTLATTDGSNLTVTPAGTLTLNSTGDMTLDSSADIILDADGADIILKDNGVETVKFTNSSTDLIIDAAGGGVLIGTGTPLVLDMASDDLFVTDDLEVYGGVATMSATTNAFTGKSLVIQSSDMTTLTIGGNTTGDILIQPSADTGDYFSFTSDGTDLTLATTDGSNLTIDPAGILTLAADVTFTGTTTLNGIEYTWPASIDANNYILQAQTNGNLAWVDPAVAAAATSYWNQNLGALYPKNSTVDLLVGGQATSSAKFAVLNMNTGTPTASISANSGNNAAYLTGTGILGTSNKQTLQIADSSTGDINFYSSSNKLDSSGNLNIAGDLQVNGANIGISTDTDLITMAANSLTVEGAAVFNEAGANLDFRVEGDTDPNQFFVDADVSGKGYVGIGTNAPTGKLHISTPVSMTAPMLIVDGVARYTGTANGMLEVKGYDNDALTTAVRLIDENNLIDLIINSQTATTDPTFYFRGDMGIGTTGPNAALEVNTQQVGKALVIFDQDSLDQNILTASASGTTKANLDISGNLAIEGSLSDLSDTVLAINDDLKILGDDLQDSGGNVVLSFDASGNIDVLGTITATLNADGQVDLGDGADTITLNGSSVTLTGFNNCTALETDGSGLLSCGSDDGGGGGDSYWRLNLGSLSPVNDTLDLLIGADATASAKFMVLNVNDGTPTASVSAGAAGGAFLTATGNLASSTMQSLTLGGASTGDILFQPSGDTANYLKLTSDATDLTLATTDSSNLTIDPAGTLIINTATIDLSNQTTAVTLNSAADALNFDSNTLSIDASGNKVGIGTAAPTGKLDVTGTVTGKALVIFDETGDQDILTASASTTPVFRVDRNGYVYSQRFSDLADSNYYLDPAASGTSLNVAGDVTIGGGEVLFTPISSPTTSSEGNVYYDSDTNHLFVYSDYSGSSAWARVALDMTQYTDTDASVANAGYVEIAHNQNTNDISLTGWFYDTALAIWRQITNWASVIDHDLNNEFNPSFTQKMKATSATIADSNTYAVYVGEEIHVPDATAWNNISWTENLNTDGEIQAQTRTGATLDSTDNTWEAWKPVVATTNEKSVESMDTHTNWGSAAAPNDVAVAEGGVARNVNYFEDEDETTTGNMTKFSSVGGTTGYAEKDFGAGTEIDISDNGGGTPYDYITAWVYATSSGNLIKLGFGEAAGNEQEETVAVDAANTWQKVYWDISDVAAASRNAVRYFRITVLTTNTTVYVDNLVAGTYETTATGSTIASTVNDYIQYRFILSTTNTANPPTLSAVRIGYLRNAESFTIDADRVRTIDDPYYYTSDRLTITESTLDNTKSFHTSSTLTEVQQIGDYDPGTGADGAITVSANKSINTNDSISGRTCDDGGEGGDAVNYSVTALTSTTATLESAPSSACLGVGDEVLLINLRGTTSSIVNLGNYETLRVQSISGSTVTFTTAKSKYYGDNANDDSNIGVGTTNQAVMLQRVPNYTTVTVDAGQNFYPDEWESPAGAVDNGNGEGGVMFFRTTGTVTINGTIHANSKGFIGAAAPAAGTAAQALGGEAFCGTDGGGDGAASDNNPTSVAGLCGGGGGGSGNGGDGAAGTAGLGGAGGGGGGADGIGGGTAQQGGGGGGGGYGAAGTGGLSVQQSLPYNGEDGGTNSSGDGGNGRLATYDGGGGGGGGTYGNADLSTLCFGSAGGAGGNGNGVAGGASGDGGGIIYIAANSITVTGALEAEGGAGSYTHASYSGGGGGGAGGSIKLLGNTINAGSAKTSAVGGAGGNVAWADGGTGGDGRVAIYYAGTCTDCSTDPAAAEADVAAYNYSVFISDEIPTPNATESARISWLTDPDYYGLVEFQTRTGKSNNSTDTTWETWQPFTSGMATSSSSLILDDADIHGMWSAAAAPNDVAVADGGAARNVDFYEDENEADTTKMTTFSSVGSTTGYAEKTIPTTDLSNYDYITAWLYATASGNLVKIGFGETTSNEQEETFFIDSSNTWQKVYWDITDIDQSVRDEVTKLRVTIPAINTTAYIDNIRADRYLTNPNNSIITSTPNDYIQYRAILTNSTDGYWTKIHNIRIEWSSGYKIVQTDANTVRLYNYTGATQNLRLDAIVFGADLAEWYATDDPLIEPGDVVSLTGNLDEFSVPKIKKANRYADSNLIGIISTRAGMELGLSGENRRLVGLQGRVPVKIAPDSPKILAGDYLTSSSTYPGLATKLVTPGQTIAKALEKWLPGSDKTKINAFLNLSYHDPFDIASLFEKIQLELIGRNLYSLSSVAADITGEYTKAVIERAGAFSKLIAANLKAGFIETQGLATEFISPLASGSAITIQADVIAEGHLSAASASISADLTADRVLTRELVAEEISVSSINNLRQKIEEIVKSYQEETTAVAEPASVSAEILALLQSRPEDDSNLVLDSVESSFGFFSDYLAVMGTATITSLNISNELNVNQQLLLAGNSISSLDNNLNLQPSGIGSINFLAGLMILDDTGNAVINGNLTVTGQVEVLGELRAPQAGFQTLLTKKLEADEAKIKKLTTEGLVIAAGSTIASESGTMSSSVAGNTTAGKAVLLAGATELTINNSRVSDDSLIYLTPLGNTQNQVLYLKAKKAGQWFTVSLNQPLTENLEFNWWIIQLEETAAN